MNILTPKNDFLGGALVSASHLGKLFPGRLYTWEEKCDFLDTNNVQYKSLKEHEMTGSSIWCNDICFDSGYYPSEMNKNQELWYFLSQFNKIILVNHQPISRCGLYLLNMLDFLQQSGVQDITVLNYRACWNTEFENLISIHVPKVKYGTLPYHYDLIGLRRKLKTTTMTDPTICAIGRSNSKCKVHHVVPELEKIVGEIQTILPDPRVSNREFLKVLNLYDITLTGYYYGGEGDPEEDVRYNKLEWSFLDAILGGSMPITSSLFKSELERLDIKVPLIDYRFRNLQNLDSQIKDLYPKFMENYQLYHSKIWNELQLGNALTRRLIEQ